MQINIKKCKEQLLISRLTLIFFLLSGSNLSAYIRTKNYLLTLRRTEPRKRNIFFSIYVLLMKVWSFLNFCAWFTCIHFFSAQWINTLFLSKTCFQRPHYFVQHMPITPQNTWNECSTIFQEIFFCSFVTLKNMTNCQM